MRAVALGQIDPNKLANSDFVDQLAMKIVNQLLTSRDYTRIAEAIPSTKVAGLWGFGPQTPGLKVLTLICL